MNTRSIGRSASSSSASRDPAGYRRPRGTSRRLVAVAGTFALVAGMLALSAPTASAASERATGSQSAGSAAQTTRDYVVRFWPRVLSFPEQVGLTRSAGPSRLIGPASPMTPLYRTIVAINDDTLYASSFVDLRIGPAILTIPPTSLTYSLLPVNLFGDRIPTTIQPQTPGTYALVKAGYQGPLPAGATKVEVPYDVTLFIIRTDKFSNTGQDVTAEAEAFRASLRMSTLQDYQADPAGGAIKIVPIVPNFAFSVKLAADLAAQYTPNLLLRAMQRAVNDPSTQPMSSSDLRLAGAFDQAFASAQQAARRGNPRPLAAIHRATVQAWDAIQANWKDNVSATNWVHPTNFAEWGTDYLDRASGNEFIQWGNNAAAAGYWQAFVDGRGRPLNGARHDYTLTFAADQIPDAERFWSLTAYTPNTVELIRNPANKYLVARYTPGLQYNADGSVTIYMSVTKPANVPTANWLPVRTGLFNVMLRVYGPTGNTTPGTGYNPPAITIAR
jgi:hypothetical protein